MRVLKAYTILLALLCLSCASNARPADDRVEPGFTRLFDGKTLDGWKLVGGAGPGYIIRDGILVAPADGGGNLFTEKEYSDYIFRFEFSLDKTGNNGVGVRAPYEGDAAYTAMECQILDDSSPEYANLLPAQYHGSLYRIVAAKRGSEKPVGEWNVEEIKAIGRKVTVAVNGKVIVDADLNTITDPAILAEHPGLLRDRGHVGFLGHGPSEVRFRNIRIKDLSKPERDNTPPKGFTALFDGKDLTNWKGLVSPDGGPPARAKMSAEKLAAAQKVADARMREHWKPTNGVLVYDGHGDSLCTAKDYGDFEMLVDWKITPAGDSGIYLRGSPQVQIWDPERHPARFDAEKGDGSGGLYNNDKNPNRPSTLADKPIGEWNRFRILMVGDKVTVYLNNVLVVHSITMENYWERDKPIYPFGQIELQNHNSILEFKNIYIRELPRK